MNMNNENQACQKSNALSVVPQSWFMMNIITSFQNFFFLFVGSFMNFILQESTSIHLFFYGVQFSFIFAFKFLIQRQKHCEEGYLMFSEFQCICFSCAKYLLGTQQTVSYQDSPSSFVNASSWCPARHSSLYSQGFIDHLQKILLCTYSISSLHLVFPFLL